MKAIILARVSTEEQKEAGNSLPAQIFRLKSYIEKKDDLELKKEFTFDESAFKDTREKFDEVVEYIEKQKEVIAFCCDKVDRLARDFLVGLPKIEKLRREGKIELHFPSDNLILHKDSPATDLFHFNIAVSLAQYYSNAISDNTKRALEQKRRKGEWTGKAPIGYLNFTNSDDTKDIILDESRTFLIQEMFRLFSTGNYSVKTILEKMTKQGLLSYRNKKLSPSMIHKILTDKFYIGIMTSKGNEYPHKYPKIVSEALFNKVQGILTKRNKRTTKYASKPFIFRGMIKCADCGCSISPELKKGKYILYSCTNYKKKHPKKIYVNEKDLLKPVLKMLDDLKLPEKKIEKIVEGLKKFNENKNKFHHANLKKVQTEYNKLQEMLDKIIDLLASDSITQEIYDKKAKEYKEKQYDLSLQLEEFTQADENYHITVNTILSLLKRAKEIFISSEVEEKQQILNFLLQNCELKGKKPVFTLRSPFNLVVESNYQPIMLRESDSNRRLIG